MVRYINQILLKGIDVVDLDRVIFFIKQHPWLKILITKIYFGICSKICVHSGGAFIQSIVYWLRIRLSNRFKTRGTLDISVNKTGRVIGNKIVSSSGYKRNCLISIGRNTKIIDCDIYMESDGRLIVGDNCLLRKAQIHLGDVGSRIIIGNNFDSGENLRLSVVSGGRIVIGDDCMFSTNIEARNSDGHSILDEKGQRINSDADIVIGNHVWIGANAVILKGAEISDDCIVGNSSVVVAGECEGNSVYAGVPAKRIKSGTTWCVKRL